MFLFRSKIETVVPTFLELLKHMKT